MVERISREEVAHVARLAQLALSEDELDAFTSQLAAVLDHAADLEALNVDDIEPSTHPFPLKNVLRVDEPGEGFEIELTDGKLTADIITPPGRKKMKSADWLRGKND